jgi:hypothetical protein
MNSLRKLTKPLTWALIIAMVVSAGAGLLSSLL